MGKGIRKLGAFNLMSFLVVLCGCFSLLYDQVLRGVESHSSNTFISLIFLLSGFWMCQHVVMNFLKRKKEKLSDQTKL